MELKASGETPTRMKRCPSVNSLVSTRADPLFSTPQLPVFPTMGPCSADSFGRQSCNIAELRHLADLHGDDNTVVPEMSPQNVAGSRSDGSALHFEMFPHLVAGFCGGGAAVDIALSSRRAMNRHAIRNTLDLKVPPGRAADPHGDRRFTDFEMFPKYAADFRDARNTGGIVLPHWHATDIDSDRSSMDLEALPRHPSDLLRDVSGRDLQAPRGQPPDLHGDGSMDPEALRQRALRRRPANLSDDCGIVDLDALFHKCVLRRRSSNLRTDSGAVDFEALHRRLADLCSYGTADLEAPHQRTLPYYHNDGGVGNVAEDLEAASMLEEVRRPAVLFGEPESEPESKLLSEPESEPRAGAMRRAFLKSDCGSERQRGAMQQGAWREASLVM
uniref:Uncharacterized protein n=1 Tax=Pyrodinium bahamense TaxID=73915 RepID=A0A7S0FF12_9DINO